MTLQAPGDTLRRGGDSNTFYRMVTPRSQTAPRALDLFCGLGGSSRGAALAGAVPVAGLDVWRLATDAYQLNFPRATTYRMKASSLDPKRILADAGAIDLLLASPECTNHSVAKGNKSRCEDSRATAFEVIRFAKALRPRWVVVENVLQMRRWHRFEEWHDKLRALGYNTATGVIDAQYHGTPQSRRRLFIVGDLEAKPSLPKPGRRTKKTVATILGRGEPKGQQWAFSPLDNPNRAGSTIERAARAINDLGEGVPFIMVYYGTDGAGGYQTMDRPLRTVTTLDRFAYVRRNGRGYEMRMLQPPELAAAMGFSADLLFPESSRRNKVKLLGNAVCPFVMRDIVRTLLKVRAAEMCE